MRLRDTYIYKSKHVFPAVFIFLAFISTGVVLSLLNRPTNYVSNAAITSAVPVRGQSGDMWADIILGKPDFSEVVPNTVVSNKFFYPRSVIVDRSTTPNHLYILDGSNSRVIGIKDINTCVSQGPNCQVDAAQGDIVIGQPNFNTSACNGDSGYQQYPNKNQASASTMCDLPVKQLSIAEGGNASSMYISPQGDLYVNDTENSRVLKYIRPFETDTIADDVWGQSDFTGTDCNKGQSTPDATSLCGGWVNGADANNNFTAGVEVDSNGNLWVADNRNHRVLRFPAGSHTADIVLGQTNFTSRTYGNGLDQLRAPAAVRVNANGVIYVADYQNNRILKYTNPATGAAGEKFGPDITYIDGLDWDPTHPGQIWAADKFDHMYELIDETTGLVTKTLGVKGNGNVLNNASGSFGIDSAGNYYVGVPQADYGSDVVYYPSTGPFDFPAKKLFDGKNVFNTRTASGITGALGVVIAGNQVVVQDADKRILFWNNPASLSNGKAADGVLEALDFTSTVDSIQGAGGLVSTIKASDNYLYVGRGRHDKPLRIEMYKLPLTMGEQPQTTYLAYPFNVLGGGQLAINTADAVFWGLQPAPDDSYLWVSHFDTNRVFRIRNPLTNPLVDVVLGQNDTASISCNRGGPAVTGATLDSMCLPGSIAMDKLGNLYVSDHSLETQGNMRLLIFAGSGIPTNNTSPIFALPATFVKNNIASWQPAFDANNRMVLGYNPYWTNNPNGGWFPGVYNNPLSNNSVPDSYLADYHSMAISSAFDSQGNLYMGDEDRSRVLIYQQPFAMLPTVTPSPTPLVTPTATPTASPTVTPSPTPSITPKPTSTPRPKDTTPPQVSITSPLNNSIVTVSTNVTIKANASDNVGLTKVHFTVNGVLVCSDTKGPYSCNWKVSAKHNVSYTIVATAFDTSGNTASSQIKVASK
jgi:hypothetical protein